MNYESKSPIFGQICTATVNLTPDLGTKVPFGVVEAINGNIKTLLRRGRGYKNLAYLLLKAQRMAVTKTEFIVLQKAA
jgi:hypothetical protein